MQKHALSREDHAFRADFEAGRCEPGAFDHRGHVRLAYAYLVENDTESATSLMRAALLGFLGRHGIDPTKYHETMTRAWILAVRHFMELSPACASAADFIRANAVLLDGKIMLSHYSAELLFSEEARARFVEPNLDEIPRHDHPDP